MDQNQPFTTYKRDLSNPIFSLNFSSVGTELFLTGKDQKYVSEAKSPGRRRCFAFMKAFTFKLSVNQLTAKYFKYSKQNFCERRRVPGKEGSQEIYNRNAYGNRNRNQNQSNVKGNLYKNRDTIYLNLF